MIEFVQGNLFDEEVEAIVNAVNCVGVMGKGLSRSNFILSLPDFVPGVAASSGTSCSFSLYFGGGRGEIQLKGSVKLIR